MLPRRWSSIAVVLTIAFVACGPNGSSPDVVPSATPTATATPMFSPESVPAVAAMALGERGVALSVNRDGWISYRFDSRSSEIGYESRVTWAPDAARPSVPLPILQCEGLPPEACFHRFDTVLQVGDDEWIYGDHVIFGSGGPFVPLAALFGPNRSSVLLIDPDDPPLDLRTVTGPFEARLCGGSQVAATFVLREPGSTSTVRAPVMWTSPYNPMERLPSGPGGAAATGCDHAARVSGVADDPSRAVVWLLHPIRGYEQVLLPSDGADASAALAIDTGLDGGQIVGWRSDAERSTPVAWRDTNDGFVAVVLPDLPGGVSCARATATSGKRIAGDCGASAVEWNRTAGDWYVAAELLPLPGDAQARVVAMSRDLAVGWSGAGEDDPDRRPVAWRLR